VSLGPYEVDSIYNQDCLAAMPKLPDACLDLVITDPPFAIDFRPVRSNYNRTQSRVIRGYKEVQARDYLQFTLSWVQQAFRLLKRSGSMYVFSGWNNLKDVLTALDEVGFITVNHIIWKYQFGVNTSRRFVTSHYHCLYVCKDDAARKFFPHARFPRSAQDERGRKLHYADKEDVWLVKREYWTGQEKTPTKLPRELIEKMLLYSSEPGDLVMDPFLGSGQVAVVSREFGRHYVGFEIVPEYYKFALERLETGRYTIPAKASSCKQPADLFGEGK